VPTTSRGSLNISATSTAGWSSNIDNNTVVFSDPNKMFQESGTGYQYWAQLSTSGAASISDVVPGTYRMTIYQLGQWGETRTDGVQVAAGQTTTPTSPQFIPENFSTTGNSPIWTLGTPDRSAHEFLNGSNDSYTYSNGNATGTPVTTNGVTPGGDFRQYQGNYNYWQEESNLGHNGYVSYYATAVGSTPATNNPLDWIGNQWGQFNPGIYDPNNNTTDGYTNTTGYVPPNGTQPSYVATGGGAASYGGSPWQVNFTASQAQINQGQYVILTVGLAASEASLTVTLNGTSETWHQGGENSDPMVRSGVAGVYQMLVFQFPVADLTVPTVSNPTPLDQFTFSVSRPKASCTTPCGWRSPTPPPLPTPPAGTTTITSTAMAAPTPMTPTTFCRPIRPHGISAAAEVGPRQPIGRDSTANPASCPTPPAPPRFWQAAPASPPAQPSPSMRTRRWPRWFSTTPPAEVPTPTPSPRAAASAV
jgi:hypothetical protein